MNKETINQTDDSRDPISGESGAHPLVTGFGTAGVGTAANKEKETINQTDDNPDPISGEPGAHPVGTGIGAAGVGTAATVIGGVVGGPVGAVVGAVVGSVIGGLAGKEAAEKLNPTLEDAHWRENFSSRPYVEEGKKYEDYQSAYQTGYLGYEQYGKNAQSYEDIEPKLQQDYENAQSTEYVQASKITWDKAKYAVRDAWDRASESSKI